MAWFWINDYLDSCNFVHLMTIDGIIYVLTRTRIHTRSWDNVRMECKKIGGDLATTGIRNDTKRQYINFFNKNILFIKENKPENFFFHYEKNSSSKILIKRAFLNLHGILSSFLWLNCIKYFFLIFYEDEIKIKWLKFHFQWCISFKIYFYHFLLN